MTRYLTILGLASAVAAVAVLSTSTAGAVSEETVQGYFAAALESGELAKVDGEQLGANTLTVGAFPPVTCSSIKYNGEAVTSGPVSTQVKISPEYETCHVNHPFLGTRTVTVTPNGCSFRVEATTTITEGGQEHFLGDPDLECPVGKQIEIHVYNTNSLSDTGASTLCTYDIGPQSDLTGITLTNKYNEPTASDDIVADFNVGSIDIVRTTGSEFTCGAEKQTAVLAGEATLRATSGGEFVSVEVANQKQFVFTGGDKVLTVKGEKGTAKLKTEKGTIECTSVKYEGTPVGAPPTELSIKPTYESCKFDNLTAHVDFEGCLYKQKLSENFTRTAGGSKNTRHTTGPMHIWCDTGKSIKIKVTSAGGATECTFILATQTPKNVVDLKNKFPAGGNTVLLTNTLTKVAYEVQGNEPTCGKNKVLLTDGALEGSVEIKAFSEAKQISLEVRGIVAPACPPKE
jgi:hypothetical protein